MKAGETRQIYIEMDWNRPIHRDVSLVAWGFDGEVTLVHNHGIKS